jgi:thiosulfate/3-mercaptopyruvate sulfurtransferase
MSRDPIIEPDALASAGAFRLLDVREPASFAAGHPVNAVRVPIEMWEAAAKSSETSFENTHFWERAIADLGVDGCVPAIVYDDGRMTESARVWFILQYFGAAAFILNGGWPEIRWRAELLATSALPPVPALFRARPGSGPVGLVDRLILKSELDENVRIFDARTEGEFAGQDLRRNMRGGHLPGARLLAHANLIDGGRLKPCHKLRALLDAAGFAPGNHIVTHCDGGGRAALAAAAAVRAGYDDVRVYYLSFADWAKDESCPLVKD